MINAGSSSKGFCPASVLANDVFSESGRSYS